MELAIFLAFGVVAIVSSGLAIFLPKPDPTKSKPVRRIIW